MRRDFFALFLFLAFLSLSACTDTGQASLQQAKSGTAKVHFVVEANGSTILDRTVAVEKGSNAFDAMRESLDIKFKEFEFGPFIEEIEGSRPGAGEFWALYVDGEMASKGIKDYSIEQDIDLRWKIEPLGAYSG
ncbi:MAG: DUF4430 domain-containing protein [Candidatus Diapherotrites archaeon]